MRLQCFFVPARSPEPAQSEMNAMLANARVLCVHREWLNDGAQSGWAFCVEVVEGNRPLPPELKASTPPDRRRSTDIDYRQVLNDADFALYARLRNTRKLLAQRDGVPPYAVCSNEQLAAIVTRRVGSLADMAAIEGMGPARVSRYGTEFLAELAAQPKPDERGPQGAAPP